MARNHIVLLIMIALSLGTATPGETTAPLTDETIVQMFVQGRSAGEIVRLIESSDVAFDVSDEMLEELQIAGVPAAVIVAMKRRQAQMEPAADDAEPALATLAPQLVVLLNPDAKETQFVRTIDRVDASVAKLFELRSAQPSVTGIGIVLFCRTADHVPDQWRAKTPLGRDFINTPRHRMLSFTTGASSKPLGALRNTWNKLGTVPGQRDAEPDRQMIELAVPERIEVPLETGVAHDLMIGIALEIDGRFYLTQFGELNGVTVSAEQSLTLRAIVGGSGKSSLRARAEFVTEPRASD